MADLKVTLFDYTGAGSSDPSKYAAGLLAFTKNTRLNMSPFGLDSFMKKPWDELNDELAYMAGTIPSSWEFINLSFTIENLSRACAQQLTRTRTAVFAMQSQRVTDMSNATWYTPPMVQDKTKYDAMMRFHIKQYKNAIENGESLEDARGLLPINLHCNIVAKYNLRGLVDLIRGRENLVRVQGEYVEIVRQMKAEAIRVYPWSEVFFEPKNAKAVAMIQQVISELPERNQQVRLAKAIDQINK